MRSEWRDKKVGVLLGGLSAEREISLMTGAAVCQALRERGYAVTPIEVDATGVWLTQAREVDVVFVALHGKFGEDGAVQGALECLGVPYTGSGVLASALAMNKPMAKRVWHTQGLPTPDWQLVEKNAPWELTLPYPVVTKPSTEGSSVGVSIVRSRETFHSALAEAFRYDPEVLVEAYVPGKEVTVGILGEEALGAMEVIAKGEFHSYEVKYTAGLEEFILPAPLPPPVYERVLGVALAAHRALGCSGYSRVDLRVTDQGEVFLLEVNSLPGLTTLSWLPRIAAAAGFDYGDLIEAILRRAVLHIQRVTP
ncbi:MAG TPA: D-alanine--D-alanine ligase [Candidatus Binatia bacterium]|nr:D-alanine--D-alanine ligase [Candidatus Binatia bacterium]